MRACVRERERERERERAFYGGARRQDHLAVVKGYAPCVPAEVIGGLAFVSVRPQCLRNGDAAVSVTGCGLFD